MLQKLKITTCAFILCLFGLTLMTVTPVFAADSAAFKQCQQIKPSGKNYRKMKQKKNCFKNLARAMQQSMAGSNRADQERAIVEIKRQKEASDKEVERLQRHIDSARGGQYSECKRGTAPGGRYRGSSDRVWKWVKIQPGECRQ
jgi:hypothetical protein